MSPLLGVGSALDELYAKVIYTDTHGLELLYANHSV